MSIGMSLGAFANGFAGGYSASGRFSSGKKSGTDANTKKGPLDLAAVASGQTALGANPPADGGTGVSASGARSTGTGLVGLIDKTEGGGDYDTLFKFSNRDGGQFAGTKLTNMTLGDVYRFTDPSGDYGQWVAANNDGTVATPVGKYQFVGSTARAVASKMGLPEDTPFNASTQDAMFAQHARDTIATADTMAGKRAALRRQWVGLRSVSDADLDAAINQFGTNSAALGARPPIS